MNTRWLLVLALCLVPSLNLAEEKSVTPQVGLDPSQPYQAERVNPVTYDVELSAVVTPPHKAKLLRVWMPIPPSDAGQEVSDSKLSSYPIEVQPQVGAEPTFGNKFAYFEFKNPEGAQLIKHAFKIKIWELRWHVEPAKVESVANWPKAFDRYLRTDQAVVVDARFQKLAMDLVPERRGVVSDMGTVMNWVNSTMTYDHTRASLKASSEFALENRRGHCSDYHGLCAAVGRALGYPTRVTYGINTFPKNSPSHCKLEVFLPPYGWVSFDVSETQKLVADIGKSDKLDAGQKAELAKAANARLTHGFRDNTWFLQTRGTDYELSPPASKRVPVVRTIYAEADGVPLADPDPANTEKREFAWMTLHKYTPDRPVKYPFEDWSDLLNKP
jgi:transglutaminase-like putative cysteine protease